ncbi:MAG TPA: adenosylhomocysteinase [Candidatus Binatia bacterium]|jgi:adenosylhomocysteinase|nr:adenosylhomocysteinase [Candidatus Binatia bacterium]
MLNSQWQTVDLAFAQRGQLLIRWAERRMPALAAYKRQLEQEKPLAGCKIGGSLHLTPETAALARCLQAGGAQIILSGSNPLSTRDEICASLVQHDGIVVFAHYGEDRVAYYTHLQAVASVPPNIVLDDGADLIVYLAQSGAQKVRVGVEQTTTGVQRLRSMAAAGVLPFPVIALNNAALKQEFDNPYGTGQNTIDGILRATNTLIAGKTVVVAGYGWAGRGIATQARGCGANVVVTEVNPVRALHAYYDGFRLLPMSQAIALGDIFITATGCREIITEGDFGQLSDGAILANSGHFDVEIDVASLERRAKAKTEIRPNLTEYTLAGGKQIYVLAQGRLVGQSAAEASPADIMDLTFTLMAMTVEWAARESQTFPKNQVLLPPPEFTDRVASMKLAALGLAHDRLTASQKEYLDSWATGT